MINSIQTQIVPIDVPVVHWGILYIAENVIQNYGPGDAAKAAAEAAVEEWASTEAPAKLVSQVVLPWSQNQNSFVSVIVKILEARTDPRGVLILREWLVEEGYETETQKRTGLSSQVPLVKKIRKSESVTRGLELLHIWMGTNGYQSSEFPSPDQCKHETVVRVTGRCANPMCREIIAEAMPNGSDEAAEVLRDRLDSE